MKNMFNLSEPETNRAVSVVKEGDLMGSRTLLDLLAVASIVLIAVVIRGLFPDIGLLSIVAALCCVSIAYLITNIRVIIRGVINCIEEVKSTV